MISDGIKFNNFKVYKNSSKIKKQLASLLKENNSIIQSFKNNYKDSFKIKSLQKLKKLKNFRLIGMGGSSLGTEAIYSFLRNKIKKNFIFINDLDVDIKNTKDKKFLNLVISKSGETIETIINANILINKFDKNIFITENKENYLIKLAEKLKTEVIEHNNFIGGRYSVLSETGMVPAYLMGLDPNKFKQFDNLIKNKKFINCLINNTSSLLKLHNQNKKNSIILNYDESSNDLFYWYQQLVAESLGKDQKVYCQ